MPNVTGLIPEIWSASILRGFEKAAVFTHCLSRLYQGDIKVGNVVKVPPHRCCFSEALRITCADNL
jgi:hypothetical protein